MAGESEVRTAVVLSVPASGRWTGRNSPNPSLQQVLVGSSGPASNRVWRNPAFEERLTLSLIFIAVFQNKKSKPVRAVAP